MVFCPRCGGENPEEAVFCMACGSRVDGSDSPAVTWDDVESELDMREIVRWDAVVALKKTPQRVRCRRVAVALSVATSLATLLFLLAWEIGYTARQVFPDPHIPPEEVMMTFPDVASASPDGLFIWTLIIATVLLAALGAVSAFACFLGPMMLCFTSLVCCHPFSEFWGWAVFDYSVSDDVQMAVTLLVPLLLMAVAFVAVRYAGKSIGMDMRSGDKNTGILGLGLTYNVSERWNVVARRRRSDRII